MRTIPLTNGFFALVDDEDYEQVSGYCWQAVKWKRGVYAIRGLYVNGKHTTISLHREILGLSPNEQVDHKNRNGLDCQRHNLRLATPTQNLQNRTRFKNNRSGYQGVYFHKAQTKYAAQIRVMGKKLHLGYFKEATDAAKAYDAAAIQNFGAFACLNFTEEVA